jgi:hypothetical protein
MTAMLISAIYDHCFLLTVYWLKLIDELNKLEETHMTHGRFVALAGSIGIPPQDIQHVLAFLSDNAILFWYSFLPLK